MIYLPCHSRAGGNLSIKFDHAQLLLILVIVLIDSRLRGNDKSEKTNRLPKQISGFTLIELLVVILIISIVAGVAVISTKPNMQQQAKTVSQIFTNQFQLAEEEALLHSTSVGLTIRSRSWQFKLFSTKKSTPTDTEIIQTWQPLFKSYHLPSFLQLTLKDTKNNTPTEPQIIISPSGDITPFTLILKQQNGQSLKIISGKNNGEIYTRTVTSQ